MELIYDDAAEDYVRTRGISAQEMDDTLNWMAINNRRNAAKNPLALERKEFAEIAKEKGFDDVMAYMRSPYNPKMGDSSVWKVLSVSATALPLPLCALQR